jgi:hypothetical protein
MKKAIGTTPSGASRLQGYAIKGYGPRITAGNRFAVITIQSLASTVYCTLVQTIYQ